MFSHKTVISLSIDWPDYINSHKYGVTGYTVYQILIWERALKIRWNQIYSQFILMKRDAIIHIVKTVGNQYGVISHPDLVP